MPSTDSAGAEITVKNTSRFPLAGLHCCCTASSSSSSSVAGEPTAVEVACGDAFCLPPFGLHTHAADLSALPWEPHVFNLDVDFASPGTGKTLHSLQKVVWRLIDQVKCSVLAGEREEVEKEMMAAKGVDEGGVTGGVATVNMDGGSGGTASVSTSSASAATVRKLCLVRDIANSPSVLFGTLRKLLASPRSAHHINVFSVR